MLSPWLVWGQRMQFDQLKRRDFITLLAGTVAWPLVARAQAQRSNVPRIGVLITGGLEPFLSEFRKGLREYGYIEGQTIAFELRPADGKLDRLRELAGELVRLKVDMIVAVQTPAVIAARQATTEIPIVMNAGDPVATGLISSLARPGGNITGLSGIGPELSAKTLEIIREVLPSTRRVALLANAPDPYSRPLVEQVEQGGRTLGIAIQAFMIRGVDELDAAFAAMEKERTSAAIVQPSLPRKPILDLALRYRLPLFGGVRVLAEEGGLMAYTGNQDDLFRRMAFYVDRILKGAKPANLPVELPTRYDLIVNLKTARVLGITIPATVLARADEVIE
jgi:putative tryptophan/tyrosine transport system substrate-binding protein